MRNKIKLFIKNLVITVVYVVLIIVLLLNILLNPLIYLPLETKEDTLFNQDLDSGEYHSIELEFEDSYICPYGNLFVKFESDRGVDVYIFNYQQYINYLEIKNGDKIGQIYYLNSISGAFSGNITRNFFKIGKSVYIVIETLTYPTIFSISYRMIIFERLGFVILLTISIILVAFAIGLVINLIRLKKARKELERFNTSY